MKLLIDVKPNTLPVPTDRIAGMVGDFTSRIQAQLTSGELEVAYNVRPGYGFVVANVESVEDAWKLLMGYAFYPHWIIEMTPLVDPIALAESGLAAAKTRQAAAK